LLACSEDDSTQEEDPRNACSAQYTEFESTFLFWHLWRSEGRPHTVDQSCHIA
jgi:hypothetical protein